LRRRAADVFLEIDAVRLKPLVDGSERVRAGRDERLDFGLGEMLAVTLMLRYRRRRLLGLP
jgi:hypothetical protein